MGWDCSKCGIRVERGSSNANECTVNMFVCLSDAIHTTTVRTTVRNAPACEVRTVCCPARCTPHPSLLPAEPFPKGLALHVCFAHLRYEKWSLDFIFFVFCAGGKTRQPFLPPACRTILKGSCIVCVFYAPLRYEFKYVTDVCVVCRRCVLYQMPRHSRKNAPSLLHDLYLLVLLRTSAMS